MRVYVGASSRELACATKYMALIATRSAQDHADPEDRIEVVSTWPENIRAVGAANPVDAPRAQRRAWARRQEEEVQRADLFWLLYPEAPIVSWADATTPNRGPAPVSFGGAWELATAHARGIPTVISGDAHRETIFSALATHAIPPRRERPASDPRDAHEVAASWIVEEALPLWNRARRESMCPGVVFRAWVELRTAGENDRL